MIDVRAYLDRIGCEGDVTLGAVHRAHVTSIPFENLDAWSGRRVSLDLVDGVTTPVRPSELPAILERRFGLDPTRVPAAERLTPRRV